MNIKTTLSILIFALSTTFTFSQTLFKIPSQNKQLAINLEGFKIERQAYSKDSLAFQLSAFNKKSGTTLSQHIIGLCKIVLNQQIYSNDYYEQNHWSLLLPMEYVFEDFAAGFFEKHFSGQWDVEYQKSNIYLTDQEVFNMQHDIFLTSRYESRKIIVNTKYKLRGNIKSDAKKGIAQSDLYQMTSYAIRRGCTEVLLLYPNQKDHCEGQDILQFLPGLIPLIR